MTVDDVCEILSDLFGPPCEADLPVDCLEYEIECSEKNHPECWRVALESYKNPSSK